MTLQELARSLGGEVQRTSGPRARPWALLPRTGPSRSCSPAQRQMASSFTPTRATIRSNARTMSASEADLHRSRRAASAAPRAQCRPQPLITAIIGDLATRRGARVKAALRIWEEAEPLRSPASSRRNTFTLGWRYLTERRGLHIGLLDDLSHALRWHQGVGAVIALMTDPLTGEPCGIHRTFLAKDATKIERKMLGRQGVIRLSPDEEVTLGLGLTEGVEDGLSSFAVRLGAGVGRDLGRCHRALPGATGHRGADNFSRQRRRGQTRSGGLCRTMGLGRARGIPGMNKDMNDLYREGINIRELADKAEPYQPKQDEVETGAVGHDQAADGIGAEAGNGRSLKLARSRASHHASSLSPSKKYASAPSAHTWLRD